MRLTRASRAVEEGARWVTVARGRALRPDSGERVRIKGWVSALRLQKRNAFVDVTDGSCARPLQVCARPEDAPADLGWGCSVEASGLVGRTPRGEPELRADSLRTVGPCPEGYPFVRGQAHPAEYVRRHLHLRPSEPRFAAALRVRDAAARAAHDHFGDEGFACVHAPVLTRNDCEGAGEVFRLRRENKAPDGPLFDADVFLTVSGQLHLEAATRGLSRTYSFGPTFRAENSRSRLHLSEFYMIEAEQAFAERLSEIEDTLEALVKGVTRRVLDRRAEDVHLLRGEHPEESFAWLDKPFPRLTYDEAVKLLKGASPEAPPVDGEGLTKEHELLLVERMGGVPTFVTDWPKAIKPFYMRALPDDPDKVAALDLLVPVTGELAGGSLREDSYEALAAKLPSPDLNWYLELRKYGRVPTGGFGLGFERYLMFVCNIPNIKDVIPFPRWPHNCSM